MEEDTKKQPDGSFKYYRFNRFYALIVVAAILAALILFVLLALCVSPQRSPLADYEWSASDKYDAELYPTLTVAPDGRFKIMQVSDLHILSGGALDRKSLDFVGRAIDAAQPDLLVVTGDLSLAADNAYAFSVWNDFISEKGVKWAFVFGNHDTDEGCPVSRDEQLAYYQTLPGCLAYDADPEMYGSGTHNLPIYASKGNDIKFNLWLFDSNDYDRENGGYDYVHQDQIDWYVKTSEELEKKAGHPVPSIAFQHIIVPEVAELLVDSPFKGETAITKKLNGQNKLLMLKPGKTSGMMLEFPCPSDTNSGEFAAWKSRGDVIAASFGHDHINTFIGNVDGIDLVMCPGVTFQSYGRYISRAVRIFELDENDPWSYNTHLYKYTDAFGWGLYSWYIGAKYGKSPAMWIPIILTAVLGVAAGVGTIVLMNNIIIGATVTAGVIALIYFITHSQQ